MRVVTTIEEIRRLVAEAKSRGEVVGLVPTMGALHEGHISLARAARKECDLVIVSVFVNPLQFGAGEDLEAYPRDLDTDVALSADAGADIVFAPDVSEVYPTPNQTTVTVAGVSEGLCGEARPVHFQGVATVVAKLFNIVGPDKAYFGRKDAQQVAVVTRMASDLNFPVEVVGCPTVREADGVAMSSRNLYMSGEERDAAVALVTGLRAAAELVMAGERRASELESAAMKPIDAEPLAALEYAELRDADSIERISELPADGRAILAVAARLSADGKGGARLIDNYLFEMSGGEPTVDEGLLATGSGRRATS